MSATNDMENGVLLLYFNNDAHPLVGDASGLQPSEADGNLYVSLHTGDPGEAGNQSTNEATYTSYARVAVPRTTGGWTVASSNVTNTAAITFPTATGGDETITHVGIGTDVSGTGELLFYSAATPNLAVSSGITPEFAVGDVDVDVT